MGSRPFGPQAGVAIHGRTCRRAESDRLRSPRISTELEKEIGKGKGTKGQRDELGTGGKPVRAIQDSGQTRPHGERAIFRISETSDTMTPAGPSARIGVQECSAEAPFLQVLATAPSPFPANYCERALYGFDSGTTRCQLPPGRFRCRCRHSKKPRPQTRERQGAWSVDAGRGQRGVQSDVRRDGGGRRRHQRRRGARGRRGRGRRSSAPFRFPCCHWHRKDSQST